MMKKYLFAILCVFLSACGGTQTKNKKVSVQSLEAKQASGVVLIKNTYYYSIDFDSNLTVYFTGIDDDGNILVNDEELNHGEYVSIDLITKYYIREKS